MRREHAYVSCRWRYARVPDFYVLSTQLLPYWVFRLQAWKRYMLKGKGHNRNVEVKSA
ncbi:MAG: hypothetical protein ACE5HG_00365 [Candidatus Bathyarchaeia archaeon]